MLKSIFSLKPSAHQRHFPVTTGLAVAMPALLFYLLDNLHGSRLAALGGLVILYTPSTALTSRVRLVAACAIAMVVSFVIGLCLRSNILFAVAGLAVFSFVVNRMVFLTGMAKMPGNIFFILIAAVGATMPVSADYIKDSGYVATGTAFAVLLSAVHAILFKTTASLQNTTSSVISKSADNENTIVSAVLAIFIGLSLWLALQLQVDNPCWVVICCLVVMQVNNRNEVVPRVAQRILGTATGVGLAWLLLLISPGVPVIIVCVLLLQMLVEQTIRKNYGLAVVFITALTMLLSLLEENPLWHSTAQLCEARLLDNVLGCLLGGVGGWLMCLSRSKSWSLLRLS